LQETRSTTKKHLELIKQNNMKKIFVSLATVIMMGVSALATGNAPATGNEGTVSQEARNSFKRDFSTASNVSWEQKNGYTRATFSLNGQVLCAYYSNTGDLTAVVRNIVSDQLPISLVTNLRKDYTGYWITDLFEISSDSQTTYYVTLENSDKKIVLKSEGTEYWGVYSKQKKESAE
jgi:uncharacterized protein YxeA